MNEKLSVFKIQSAYFTPDFAAYTAKQAEIMGFVVRNVKGVSGL